MKIKKEIIAVVGKIIDDGFEISIVGGAVRNILQGVDVDDWDFTTNAKPDELLKIFPDAFYNNDFGTVGVNIDGENTPLQVTTYRSEAGYSDKRHPDKVTWGKSLEEDLKRRDFTINAMAFKVAKLSDDTNDFELVDMFGGQDDLKSKLIRTVGNADERIAEDALRMMRAARLATVMGFEIEKKTKAAIASCAKLISNISAERVRDELFKIVECEKGSDGILLLREVNILGLILPELEACFAVEQKSPKRHHVYDVGTHCVNSLKFCPSSNLIVRFATLLHDIGKAKVADVTKEGVRTFYNHEVVGGRQAREISQRLHLSRDDREKLFKLVRFHQFSVNENQTDKALRRFIKNIGVENIEDMMDLRIGDRLGGGLQQAESWRLKLFRRRLAEVLNKPFTVADLKISGHDVMSKLGIKPGKKVGEILAKLFEEVADDKKKNSRTYLLKRVNQLK